MKEAAIQEKLRELHEAFRAEPAGEASKPPVQGIYVPQRAEQMTLEDSIDLLRLKVKYLLLDIEATKRENRYLRQMLDSRPRHDADAEGEGPKF